MKQISALIFGYNEYSFEIAKNILYKYSDVHIFKLKDDNTKLEDIENSDDFNIDSFDLSDKWDDLKLKYDLEKSVVFCAIEDDAQNIFLTISLRAIFDKLTIIALSKNKESANKLTLAGANKVIPLVQTTAGMIADMLEKPIVTNVLHNILYEQSDLKIAQIRVSEDNIFKGKYISDVEWGRDHGVIVLSVTQKDMSSSFIYSTKTRHHPIDTDDLFVVVGYENDIAEFEKLIGGRCDVDWSSWSW